VKKVIFVSAALLSAAWAMAQAQTAAPAPLTDVVASRQASMALLYGTWQGMRAGVAAKVEPRRFVVSAKGIAPLARQIPALFPPGSGIGRLGFAAIYDERADFEKMAAAMATAGEAVLKAAQANDEEAFATAVKGLSDSCGGCHTKRFGGNWAQ